MISEHIEHLVELPPTVIIVIDVIRNRDSIAHMCVDLYMPILQ